jgi:hypothetical protein
MIAPFIGVTALAAAIQFVYYCRSALAVARNIEPSPQVMRVVGFESRNPDPADFQRLLELAHLCPEHGKDRARTRAVTIYYRVLEVVRYFSRPVMPVISAWVNREQQACSHFAALVLDRRISSGRDLFLQHSTNRL